jgi:hypothetical protein
MSLFYVCLIRVSCIILTFHLITRYMCKLDMIVYSVNYGVLIPPVHIRIVSILFGVCSAAVQKVKSYGKSKQIPAFGVIEFYC